MKILAFLTSLLFTALNCSFAQSVLEGWEGDYEGRMVLGYATGYTDSLDVTFEFKSIEKDSSWAYKFVFKSEKFGEVVKGYEIQRDRNSTTNFVLDEKDGTVVELTWMNGCFYDMYSVMDNFFMSTLCKFGSDLRFDLFMSSAKPSSVTVSEEDEEGNTYEVSSYKPTLHQSVILKRM